MLTNLVTKRLIITWIAKRWFGRASTTKSLNNVGANFKSMYDPKLVCCEPVSTVFNFQDVRNYSSGRSSHRDGKHKKDVKTFLSDEELSQVIDVDHFKLKLSKPVEKLKESFVKHLSVRTNVGAIESLKVNFEGEEFDLNELAQISRKNPKLLVINMVSFPQAIKAVLDAIGKSGFNLNPQQEGTTVYVPIPPLTREHRENLAKNAKSLFVQTSDELRDIQNEIIRSVKKKKGNFSEDLIYNAQQQIMKITNEHVSECEVLMQKKQAELLGKDT